MHTYYPIAFPLICLRKMKDILAEGDVIERRVELAKCWWLVEGFAYRTFLGDPHEPSQYVAAHEKGTEEEFKMICCEVAELCGREMDREGMGNWSVDRYLSMAYAALQKFMWNNRMKIFP